MRLSRLIPLCFPIAYLGCGQHAIPPFPPELSRYVANLSESQDRFPAYADLMKSGNCEPMSIDGSSLPDSHLQPINLTIPCEVKHVAAFFADKSQTKQLQLVGQSNADANSRVYAFAKSDSNTRVIEILSDRIVEDSKIRGWDHYEQQQILQAIFEKYHNDNTVFVVNSFDAKLMKNHHLLIKSRADLGHLGRVMTLGFVHLPELVTYAEKLAESKNIDKTSARKAAMLLFAFAPNASFLEKIETILDRSVKMTWQKDPVIQAVLWELQLGHNLEDAMQKFASDLANYEPERLLMISRMLREDSKVFTDHSAQRDRDLLNRIKKIYQYINRIGDGLKDLNLDDKNN